MNYADAKRRAAVIAEAAEKRHMPPWLPSAAAGLRRQRRLREAEISMIRRRADAGP
jgi:hypothetical protein